MEAEKKLAQLDENHEIFVCPLHTNTRTRGEIELQSEKDRDNGILTRMRCFYRIFACIFSSPDFDMKQPNHPYHHVYYCASNQCRCVCVCHGKRTNTPTHLSSLIKTDKSSRKIHCFHTHRSMDCLFVWQTVFPQYMNIHAAGSVEFDSIYIVM